MYHLSLFLTVGVNEENVELGQVRAGQVRFQRYNTVSKIALDRIGCNTMAVVVVLAHHRIIANYNEIGAQ